MPKSFHSDIQQIPLHQMERGLAQPVATLNLEPAEISSRLGVKFETTRDDLDDLDAAVIQSAGGRQFALVRHRHQPQAGTDILTSERSRDLGADLRDALGILRFGVGDLCWTHPTISTGGIKSKEAAKIAAKIEALQFKLASILGKLTPVFTPYSAKVPAALASKAAKQKRHMAAKARRAKR
jgi:hypothetical protein